ncbi:Uncharacterised protein [Candidatus Norongarragalina meridionalis]|nr:Uncharacterised protein [Candidatus Norongarragalina meridionalis]
MRMLLGLLFVSSLVFAASCIDTDGGLNYVVKGTCTDAWKNRTDTCANDWSVGEWACTETDMGYCYTLIMNCHNLDGNAYCYDGACVLPGRVTPTPKPSATPTMEPVRPTAQPPFVIPTPSAPSVEAQPAPPWGSYAVYMAAFVLAIGAAWWLVGATKPRMHERKKKWKR